MTERSVQLASHNPLAVQLVAAIQAGAFADVQRVVARLLHTPASDVRWIGYAHKTPLDAERESGNADLVQ